MPALNLLLLPLLSGYYFTHKCIPLQIPSERLQGHRLVFNSALWGLVFFMASYLICFGIQKIYPPIFLYWTMLIPYDYVGTTLLSLGIGIFMAHILNPFFDKNRISTRLIESKGTEFEKLFFYAAQNTKLLSITLKNNKVYIGFMVRYPDPNQNPKIY